jgi:peptidoglycan/LPS O-acetylase OafA/YrhL
MPDEQLIIGTRQMNRIPSLDGWRGIAITLVLVDHLQDSILGRHLGAAGETGYHGVVVFFVLSGFLITSKLVESPINLKRFYLRRFFRLMPAAWAFLIFLVVLGAVTHKSFTSGAEIASCLLCYRNFVGKMGFAGHFWSLSVEEQFYLVWPVTLMLAGSARARRIALFGAIACSFFREMTWPRYGPRFPTGPTVLHSDWLLIGCCAALLLHDQQIRERIAFLSKYWAPPALCIFLFCIFSHTNLLAELFAIAALIVATTLNPTSVLARIVSIKPLAWLGTISYSVYLWQGFFLPQHTVWGVCVLPLFALASFYLIERPFTRLGHRLTRTTTSQANHDLASRSELVHD